MIFIENVAFKRDKDISKVYKRINYLIKVFNVVVEEYDKLWDKVVLRIKDIKFE